ncbi:MAG: hypothetical protein WBM28_10585 [Burkholderiales bacterium]
MSAVTFASLDWNTAPMPGSNAPVQLAQLPSVADGAFQAFVRFPAGWARPGPGYYSVAEELLILEGDLHLNDMTWHAGGYAWIQENRVRSASRSESGCLAFAWFASAPHWIPGEPNEAVLANDVILAHWRDAPERTLGTNDSGRQLYTGREHHTWVVQRRQVPLLATSGTQYETIDLHDRAWCSDAAHEPQGDPTGAVLVRVWHRS